MGMSMMTASCVLRILRLAVALSPLALAACGSSPPPSLSVTCGGTLALSGVQSLDVNASPGGAVSLSYPDPVNTGHSGNLPVHPGIPCTVGMTSNRS